MLTNREPKTGLFKTFAWISGLLCVLCCSFPILAVMLGAGSVTVLAALIEKSSLVFLLLATGFFTAWYIKKKRAPACDIHCASKPSEKSNKGQF